MTTADEHDLLRCGSCNDYVDYDLTFPDAQHILRDHASHGGDCRQFLAALTRVSEVLP